MRNFSIKIAAVVLSLAATQASAASSGPPMSGQPAKCKNALHMTVKCPTTAAKPTGPGAPVSSAHSLFGLHPLSGAHPASGGPNAPVSAPHPLSAPQAASAPHAAPKASGPSATANSSPVGAIAKCKDGLYWHGKSHGGSCAHHNGVANWL